MTGDCCAAKIRVVVKGLSMMGFRIDSEGKIHRDRASSISSPDSDYRSTTPTYTPMRTLSGSGMRLTIIVIILVGVAVVTYQIFNRSSDDDPQSTSTLIEDRLPESYSITDISNSPDNQHLQIDSFDVSVMTDEQIESEVRRIRELWNTDRAAVSDKIYSVSVTLPNVTSYYYNGQIKIVEVLKGMDEVSYSRTYQYENGNLIFAYLDGVDAHRLYFINNNMFRWRYTPDATKNDEAVNYDRRMDMSDYLYWQEFAINEAYSLLK